MADSRRLLADALTGLMECKPLDQVRVAEIASAAGVSKQTFYHHFSDKYHLMEHCFRDLALERLYLDHYTGNPAAYLYQSLGFQYEGVLRRNCRKNGVLYDVHLMSMLREEYEEKYGQAEAAFRSADAPLTAW